MNSKVIDVIPGVGPQKSFSLIEKRVKLVAPFCAILHIDIADGVLVPNKTHLDPTPYKKLIEETGKDFELHMMVDNPFSTIESWVSVGFTRLLLHVEALKKTTNLEDKINRIKTKHHDLQIGLALDHGTPVEAVFPYLRSIDTVLVMTIKAGFSGQTFVPELLEKVRKLRAQKEYLPIEVDGGINDETGRLAVEAGANRLVSTSYIYNAESIEKAIWTLKNSNVSQV